MKVLYKYMKTYRKEIILAISLVLLEVMAEITLPKLMSKIINVYLPAQEMTQIIKIGGFMVGLTVMSAIGGIMSTWFASKVSQWFCADVKEAAYSRIMSFSASNIDHFTTPSLITRLTSDINTLQTIIQVFLRLVVRAPILFLGSVFFAFSINKDLTMVFVVIFPILVTALAIIITKSIPYFGKIQIKLDKLNSVLRESLFGARVIRAFVREDYENEKFQSVNDEYLKLAVTANRMTGLIMPVLMFLINAAIISILWIGGNGVNAGNIAVGDIIAFITYSFQILFSLLLVAFLLMMTSRAKVSAMRISEILNREETIRDIEKNEKFSGLDEEMIFENVYFSYKGDEKEALKNINFSIRAGETIGIIGGTGSGKSSIISLIIRYYDVTKGNIKIDGKNIKNISLGELRGSIGLVRQQDTLLAGTIEENIKFGNENSTFEDIKKAAKTAQAEEFIEKMPEKYKTVIGQRGAGLSGGQKQRMYIARALLKKPSILLLDDSSSALDMKTEAKLQEELKNLDFKCTKIIVAQRISSVRAADKIIVLDRGYIAGTGTHHELLESNVIYKEIYDSQIEAGEGENS